MDSQARADGAVAARGAISLDWLSGGVLAILGAAVLLGWLYQSDFMVRILPQYAPMKFNTALSFVLVGAAISMATRRVRWARAAGAVAAAAAALLALAVLAQHVLGIDFRIDWPSLHAKLDAGEHPGRVSAATASAFAMAASGLLLVSWLRRRWARVAARALASGTALIGGLGVIGYVIAARLLFPDYWFVGMAIHTAAGLCLLAGALWLAAGRLVPSPEPLFRREDDRITFVAALVLVAMTLTTGVATFFILQERVQELIRDDLQLALARRAESFEDFIALHESQAQIAATRPAVARNLRAIRAGHDDGSHIANVRAVIDSFMKQGFSAIAYRDADGRLVAGGGTFVAAPQMAVPINTPQRAELLWDGGFKLRHRIEMMDGEGKAGEMLAEQPIPVLIRLTEQPPGRGPSWDMGLCVRGATELQCFPQRLNPRVFFAPLANVDGAPFPMTRALGGESGTTITSDYRAQNVIAAFGPVKDLGMGMVVKVDTAEVLQPVRDELAAGFALLLVVVAAGALLLRYQVLPLATRLEERVAKRTVDLNRALEALGKSERHYRDLFDANPHPMWVHDLKNLKLLAVNDAAIRQYGYSRDELLRMTVADFHPPAERDHAREAIQRLGPSQRHEVQVRHRRKSGEVIEAMVVSEPIHFEGEARRLVVAYDITERRRLEQERLAAEQALRESEAGLRHAQKIARLAHVVVGIDGSYESTSESMAELLGASPDDAPRGLEAYLRYVHPEDLERLRGTIRSSVRTREPYATEYRIIRNDGRVVHIRQEAEWLSNADGSQPTRRFVTLQDVTEQRSVQQKQRETAQLLDNIVDNIPTAVQLKSVQEGYRVVMWNKAAEAMYGVPREEAIGRNVHDLWPQEDADRFHAADVELIASGQMQDFPNRAAQTKARGEIRVHMRKVALFDAAGKATHLLVIADDITSQLEDQARLRDSESLKGAILESSLDCIITIDHAGRIVEFNPAAQATFGLSREQALGKPMAELIIPPRLREAHQRGFTHYLATGEGPILGKRLELQAMRADGSEFPIELAIVATRSGAEPTFTGFLRDITERKQAEQRIRRLNRVYAVLSQINTLIVRARDRDEVFREASRVAVEQGGFRMAWIGVVDQAAGIVRPVASAGEVGDFFEAAPLAILENKPGGHGLAGRAVRGMKPVVSNNVRNDAQRLMKKELDARGINSVALIPLIIGGEATGVFALYAAEAGFFDDDEMKLLVELAGNISFALEHLAKSEKLDFLAYYDPLTGLANRALLQERLEQLLHTARRDQQKLALLIFDVERFKSINDSLGRDAGDALLKQIGERMAKSRDDPTRAARLGGDQFALVLPRVRSEEELPRRIQGRFEEFFGEPFHLGQSEIRVSAKLGIAMFPQDGGDPEALLRSAEAAVKSAKTTGERYVFFTREMTARIADKLSLESRLRRALEKEEFVLHYQPKVGREKREVVGVEALLRWRDPEKGLVPPLHFIPLLEETGLILQVGAWALKRAALDHRAWSEAGLRAPRVAVNVSAIQLRQRDFVAMVELAVRDGVVPTAIDLEITESLLMGNIKENIEKLKAVRGLGAEIAIDDFGTGYSSLSYLSQLPVSALKIDRSFIVRMQEDPNAMTLVSTMISLAHSLRLKVVAEGVETEDQAKFLRLLRCDEMQGFLFSKPLPAEELLKLLG